MKYKLLIPPEIVSSVRHLHPQLKSKVRAALSSILEDPHLGKPLKYQLKGLWSFRVSNYRIVYSIDHSKIIIHVVDIAERKLVYEKVSKKK